MTTAEVSVVIPTFNRPQLTEQAVRSVEAQTASDLEIIVVDDGSTPQCHEELRACLSGTKAQIVRLESNRGPAAARNVGVGQARGRYVAFLDADDLWLPNKLAQQLGVLRSDAKAGWCYTNLFNWQPQSRLMYVRYRKRQMIEGNVYWPLVYRRLFISWIGVIARRECLEAAGPFDERLRRHEDRDMSIRMARLFPVKTIDQPLAIVRMHGEGNLKDSHDVLPLSEWVRCDVRVVEKVLAAEGDRDPELRRRLSARYHYVWGRQCANAGDWRSAVAHYSRSIRLDPKEYRAYAATAMLALPRHRGEGSGPGSVTGVSHS